MNSDYFPPSDYLYDSPPTELILMGGNLISEFNSIAGEYIAMGGDLSVRFDSIAGEWICIGGATSEVFYESVAVEAEATILYAWGRDYNAGRVTTDAVPALCVKITEI